MHSKDIRINGLDISSLPADAKRSLVQSINASLKRSGVRVGEPTPPIRVTATKAQPDALTEALSRLAEILGVSEATMPVELTVPPSRRRVITAPAAAIRATTPRTTTRRTTRRPARVNTFYEDVIVGGYEKRVEAKPYKCENPACYKYGHRFTETGWLGNGTAQGHAQIAARFHPRGR